MFTANRTLYCKNCITELEKLELLGDSISRNKIKEVKTLIKWNANVESNDIALSRAVQFGAGIEIFDALISAKCDVNLKSGYNLRTALMKMAQKVSSGFNIVKGEKIIRRLSKDTL